MAAASDNVRSAADCAQMDDVRTRKKKGWYEHIKRVLDVVLAVAALAMLVLPMLLIAVLILLFDGRPVLYRQARLGCGGKRITIYKFRSMCRDADGQIQQLAPELQRQYAREFKIDRDPRVTRFGALLRRTSIDELPQLWNILRGELSFVGPRPILPEELGCYAPEERPLFLSVRPGLTGYWQAYAKNEDTYTSGRRQKMELYYASNLSFGFDIRILFQTVLTVIRKAIS